MPRRPSLTVRETPKGFLVHVPASLSSINKLERRYFKERKDAEAFAATLRTKYHSGIRGGVVDAGTAMQAAEAMKMLKDSGVPLLDAVKAFVDARATLEPYGATLGEAVESYARNAEARGVNETFRERYDRFFRDNENDWSSRYRRDMEKLPQWVGDDFMAMPVAAITEAVIDDALRENGAAAKSTRKARSSRVLPVLNQRTRKKRASRIEIMNDEQIEKMLEACRTTEESRVVALLLFAGVRPDGEIRRLDWSSVGQEEIYISAEVSKTGSDRFIPVAPRLRRAIEGHPESGTVLSADYTRRIQAIRKAAGIAGKQDITRHTFASHFLIEHGEDKTKSAMGHTPNSQTLFRAYRRAVTETQAKEYFQ